MSGHGGRLFEGRCNRKGIATVYCSEHISLCALEVLVHFKQRQAPDDYVVVTISIPGTIAVKRGNSFEAKNSRLQHPLWIVPSAIIAREMNIILYPEAHGFSSQITDIEGFQFDRRLVEPTPHS
jgi:RES domain-containing protein